MENLLPNYSYQKSFNSLGNRSAIAWRFQVDLRLLRKTSLQGPGAKNRLSDPAARAAASLVSRDRRMENSATGNYERGETEKFVYPSNVNILMNEVSRILPLECDVTFNHQKIGPWSSSRIWYSSLNHQWIYAPHRLKTVFLCEYNMILTIEFCRRCK